MTDTQAKNIYFLGIGGIGMSAIARYYLLEGVRVGGYDRTETALTRALASEGADIHYEDDPARIAAPFRNPDDTLVVYTPAIPHDHAETAWFRSRGFRMLKRSEILGVLAADKYVMAVAGTHGKTTTTTLTAWLNHVAGGGGSAFLGGQNDVKVFCDLAKNIKFENCTIYDQLLNEGLQTYMRDYFKGTVTEDQAWENFYKYVNEKYPSIVTPSK